MKERCGAENSPTDWCYVNNFEDIRRPKTLRLPTGRGVSLRKDVESLIDDLETAITCQESVSISFATKPTRLSTNSPDRRLLKLALLNRTNRVADEPLLQLLIQHLHCPLELVR